MALSVFPLSRLTHFRPPPNARPRSSHPPPPQTRPGRQTTVRITFTTSPWHHLFPMSRLVHFHPYPYPSSLFPTPPQTLAAQQTTVRIAFPSLITSYPWQYRCSLPPINPLSSLSLSIFALPHATANSRRPADHRETSSPFGVAEKNLISGIDGQSRAGPGLRRAVWCSEQGRGQRSTLPAPLRRSLNGKVMRLKIQTKGTLVSDGLALFQGISYFGKEFAFPVLRDRPRFSFNSEGSGSRANIDINQTPPALLQYKGRKVSNRKTEKKGKKIATLVFHR